MESSSSPSIFRSWINVLTQPGEEIFEQEGKSPNATLSTALIWVVIAAIIAAIFGVVSNMIGMSAMGSIQPFLEGMDLPPEQRAIFDQALQQNSSPATFISSFVSTLIIMPLVFLAGAGFTSLVSKMFGGQGTFGRTAYLQSLFVVPFYIISSLPVAGGCIGIILFIYNIVLWFFSTKAEHNLTTGKTIGVAIVAGIALIAVFACIGGVIGTVMAGAMGVMPQ